MSFAIFSDFDGTLTDRDTIDLLVEQHLGAEFKRSISERLHAGRLTIREALSEEFSQLRLPPEEIREFLCRNVRLDPRLNDLIRLARERAYPFTILSSGMDLLILPLLEQAGATAALRCNRLVWIWQAGANGSGTRQAGANGTETLQTGPNGNRNFRIEFVDDSPHGHDKAAALRQARAAGHRIIYMGDGLSDLPCAHEADVLFARRTLERYCRERDIACRPFAGCADVIEFLQETR